MDEHLLSLNYKKSLYMTFSPTARTQPVNLNPLLIHSPSCSLLTTVTCQCPVLNRTKEAKYLGVLIRHLIFKSYKISKLRNIEISRLVYFAYAQSVLQYGILIWGGASNTYLNKIFMIQKQIIKATLGKNMFYPSNNLFSEFKVLTIKQLYIKNLLLFINKNKNLFVARTLSYNIRQPGFETYKTNIEIYLHVEDNSYILPIN